MRNVKVIEDAFDQIKEASGISNIEEMSSNMKFQPVISESNNDTNSSFEKIIFCSGKIYYDLLENRSPDQNISLIRLEQLYPFPAQELGAIIAQHPEAEIVWCQEEPKNMGAWTHVFFALKDIGIDVNYIGRPPAGSPATGYTSVHQAEQSAIIQAALTLKRT